MPWFPPDGAEELVCGGKIKERDREHTRVKEESDGKMRMRGRGGKRKKKRGGLCVSQRSVEKKKGWKRATKTRIDIDV